MIFVFRWRFRSRSWSSGGHAAGQGQLYTGLGTAAIAALGYAVAHRAEK